jgi:predicted aldo/keto reductase-like oxidoreductase
MEPVRGGKLANLPAAAQEKLRALRPEASDASWALRWVQEIPGVTMILSGMSNMAQMQDNLATFDHPEPLSVEEQALLLEIAEGFKSAVPCTACRYCCDGCPQEIDIPQMLRVLNELRVVPSTNAIMAVEALPKSRQPKSCLGCGACTAVCPQKIDIPGCMQELTERIAKIPSWIEISRQRAAEQP